MKLTNYLKTIAIIAMLALSITGVANAGDKTLAPLSIKQKIVGCFVVADATFMAGFSKANKIEFKNVESRLQSLYEKNDWLKSVAIATAKRTYGYTDVTPKSTFKELSDVVYGHLTMCIENTNLGFAAERIHYVYTQLHKFQMAFLHYRTGKTVEEMYKQNPEYFNPAQWDLFEQITRGETGLMQVKWVTWMQTANEHQLDFTI